MAKIPQTQEELERHLRENIGFLEASAAAFDVGHHAEAKRLAATIRVLVHDTPKSRSLLGLVGIKAQLGYVNTAIPFNPANLLTHHGLVGIGVGPKGPAYWAPLEKGPRPRYGHPPSSFEDWWSQVVINDKSGGIFTRKDLVLALANKDGGAHVDPELEPSYAALTRDNSVGWTASNGHEERPLSDIELHSVRQIAYELIETLRTAGMTAA